MKLSLRTSVVDQVVHACKPRNRAATVLGFLLGGFVPLASYFVAHREVLHTVPLYAQASSYFVAGGLAYSAKTVFAWGKSAFQHGLKAVGFVLLLEGVMVASGIAWLSVVALGYLIAINGIATGCNLALARKGGAR